MKELIKQYPTYSLIVTGHSLGGALANLAFVDFRVAGFGTSHYSFGSPRVGNQAFSDYVKSLGIVQRITHYQDPVPHLPWESMDYVHAINEVYEDEIHVLHACNGVNDPSCAEQWELRETSGDDHTLYLNLPMHCDYV